VDTPLRGHLGFWLRLVSNHVSQAFAAKLAVSDVGVAEWAVLRLLHEHGALMPSRLAAELGMTRGAVSKLVERLEGRALLSRTVSASDRRCQALALTPAGRALVPELTALADRNDAEFFGALSTTDRAAMERVLREIARRHGLATVPVT